MATVEFIPMVPVEETTEAGVFVKGTHSPNSLVRQSGVWFASAGSAILLQSEYQITPCEDTLWLILEEGQAEFVSDVIKLPLAEGECVVIPANRGDCRLTQLQDARVLWFTMEGPVTSSFLAAMNALNRVPAKQGMLPSMVELARQVLQVLVRHDGTEEASFQLQQLLWGMAAMYSGQSVARGVTLSHEIARVVDTMRANRYKDGFSLTEMAAISRMPVETFRKRFTTELGIPPLAYLQFLKMERAKTILREGVSVRQAGVEIGMPDPYHFSKQFKRVVGVSPTAYLKQIGVKGPLKD